MAWNDPTFEITGKLVTRTMNKNKKTGEQDQEHHEQDQ
jgi:hypothetical protein